MSRHIIYIINPISGTRSKKDLHELVEKRTRARSIPFDIFPSVASGDYSFLVPLMNEKKTTDVIIAGGDGTVSQCIASLMKQNVNFGIIPCGSGNGLALAAHIPRQHEKAIDVSFDGVGVATDGFHINDNFACMLCGLGFDAQVAHDFAQKPTRGLATYIKQVVNNFFSAKTYSFDIKLPGNNFSTDAFFISIANSNQFGNNFTIAPRARLNDGLLDIVIVTEQNKLNLLLQTIKQVTGRNELQTGTIKTKNKAVLYFQTPELEIINRSEAPLHIDGDPAETKERFKIKVNPGCFRLLQPR